MVALIAICVAILLAAALVKRAIDRRELELHTITPEELHALLASNRDVLVLDVRQPLDLLADSVMIPGAKWFAPQTLLDDPSFMPARREMVLYCTCPSDETSRAVLNRALAIGFSRIKVLKGGLEGWRRNGYPVEPYQRPFPLDSGQNRRSAAAD